MHERSLIVFLSSRSDLPQERRAAATAITELGHRVDNFEDWPALSQPPLDASIAAVKEADILVLLLGRTYGPLASKGRSITHVEYDTALANQIRVLAFRVGDADPELRQAAFISEVRKHQTIHAVASIDALKKLLQESIQVEIVQRFRSTARESPPATEIGVAAERRLSITIDLQTEEIEHLRDALTRHVAERLNEARTTFRTGRTLDAMAMLEHLRADSQWNRVGRDVQGTFLTTSAMFRRATGGGSAEIESLLEEAKQLAPTSDYSYFDALLQYDNEGAERALEMLDVVETTNSLNLKVALLLELDRISEASHLLAHTEPITADAETERLRCLTALAERDAEAAIRIIDAALQHEPQSESLRVSAAIAYITSTIVPSERPRHVGPWLPPIDSAFVVTSPEMLTRLEKAATTLDEAILGTQRTGEALQQMRAWRLAAIALHPSRRKDARATTSEMLQLDPGDPIALVWSIAFDFHIDLERAVTSLSEPTGNPPEPPRVVAVVAAIEHGGDFKRAANILDRHRSSFEGEEDLWKFWKSRFLSAAGDFDEATAMRKTIGSEVLLRTSELLVAEMRAKATGEWDDFLSLIDRIDPGYAALAAHARLGRWNDVVDQAVTLLGQAPTAGTVRLAATALFRLGRNAESLEALELHAAVWEHSHISTDLRRLVIQNQVVLGRVADALERAEQLFGITKLGRDLLLIVHVAISTGRQKIARHWAERLLASNYPDIAANDLLQISRTIAVEDRDLARKLWRQAEKFGFGNEQLVEGMNLALALGLEDEGQRLAQQAMAAGLGRTVDVNEIQRLQEERGTTVTEVARGYLQGDVPLVMLLSTTNRSLAEVFEAQFLASRHTAVGSMPPLYIRHGGRMLNAHLSLRRICSLTLDISTILLADHLGLLDAIEKRFKTLRISPITCTALVEQQQRLHSKQVSVDEALAVVVRLFDDKQLSELVGTTPMQAALDNQGYLVDDLPLRDPRSGAEIDAPPELAGRLRSPDGFGNPSSLPAGSKLYLSSGAAFTLAHRKLLESLTTEFALYLEEGTFSFARGQTEECARRATLTARLAKLAERFGEGLSSGKYQALTMTRSDHAESDLDLTTQGLIDFFHATGEKRHAFVVDDRFASSQLMLANSPVVTIVNVLAELRTRKLLADDRYFNVLVQLRRANYRYIDLDGDEIVHWLMKAKITNNEIEESAQLQLLRIYLNAALSDRNMRIVPLPMTNPNGRAFGEGAFAMNSSFATVRALCQIWSLPDLPPTNRIAMSDWILRSLYTGTYGIHHLYGEGFNAARVLMAEDVGSLLTTVQAVLSDDSFDLDRGKAFIGWLYSRVVAHRLDSDPDMLGDIAETVKKHLLLVLKSDTALERRVVRAQFSVLPPAIKLAVAKDDAFATTADLRARQAITIGGFSFAADSFWPAIDELRTNNIVIVRSDTGSDVRILRAEGAEGLYFDDGGVRRFFPDDTFAVLAFRPEEEQRKHLHDHPEIFDVGDDALDDAINEILLLPTRERVERHRDIAKHSAASHYADLRRLFDHAPYTFDDLFPPSDALLRHYLPGHVKGQKLDSAAAFAPLAERHDLLDVLRRAIVLPVPLSKNLRARFTAESDERRAVILSVLREEAASPVARAQLAILGYASPTEADRQVALQLVEELSGSKIAAGHVSLFMIVLRFVYWRLSRDPQLGPDVRLLLTWAHAGRLIGVFKAAGADITDVKKQFVDAGNAFADDSWTRSAASLDVLHPETSTGVRTVAASLAHVVASVPNQYAMDVSRHLEKLIFPQKIGIPVLLMRDTTLATNVCDSFLVADLAEALASINVEGASILSLEGKREILTRSMRELEHGQAVSVAWTLLGAILGNLPPPPEFRTSLEQFVLSPALDKVIASDNALDALWVLADLQTHFGDEYRQRVEDLAAAALTRLHPSDHDAASKDANRWLMISLMLAARPGSREQTGSALGRALRRFIDASPAIAPFAATMLTNLPFQLPMEYLPALWPAVIAARATAHMPIH